MKKVKIEARMGQSDCEDCGSFSHGEAIIEVDGGPAVEVGHDGHFGAGCWDGTELGLRRIALGLSGIAPFIGGELPEDIPLVDSGRKDCSGSAEWVRAHEAGPWRRVDIDLETLGDDPWYPTPVRARWMGADGLAAEHVFDQGDWDPFWGDFCKSFLDVDMDFDPRALDEE